MATQNLNERYLASWSRCGIVTWHAFVRKADAIRESRQFINTGISYEGYVIIEDVKDGVTIWEAGGCKGNITVHTDYRF